MLHSLQIIRSSDFLLAGAHGHPDLASSRRALAEVAATMIARGVDRALLDLRDVTGSGLTTTEIFTLATTFHTAGFRQEHRLAVLHRSNRVARADFFAMCAAQRGWTVRAFDTLGDALEWLVSAPVPPYPPPAAATGTDAPIP